MAGVKTKSAKRLTGSGEDRLALSAWVRLVKSYNLVLRQARQRLGKRCTLPQFDVLAQLARSEDGMSFSELSRHLIVTSGNLTGIVDRLEDEGLVYRETHPDDRRSIKVRLTPKGRRFSDEIIPQHGSDIEEILSVVPRADLSQLRELLGRINHALEKE
jgi:DNA-binding MarR family transcriptional regulator